MKAAFRDWTVRLAAAFLVLLTAAPGKAQQRYADALVPLGHWSIDAVLRLSGLGLVPGGHDLSQRMPSQRDIGLLLEAAAAQPSRYRSLATGYRERFQDEFGRMEESSTRAARLASHARGSALGVGGRYREGDLVTGWGYGFGYPGADWNQPEERPDASDVTLDAVLQVAAGPAAVRFAAQHPREGEAVREAYVAGRAGVATLWAGRREFGWGPAVGPGIVMSRGRYDSVGAQTSPFHLPWFLRHLGPVSMTFALGQDDKPHSFDNTGFLATRGSVTPHPRIQLGVTRAAEFGGDGNTEIDLFAIFSLLIGKHAGEVSELDNQVVAVDMSFRPPTERWLPMRAYLEWGFEDSAGAWKSVPGILAGIDVPALPGFPAMALAVERVYFAPSCCNNPIWYRHSTLWDGWTQDGRPLGHPLGGHGNEWSVRARLHPGAARLRASVALFARERGIENLYADVRTGDSRGGSLDLELDVTRRLRIRASGAFEDGAEWRETGARLGLQATL